MDDVLINFGGGIEAKSVGDGLTELRGPSVIFDPHEGGGSDLVKDYFAPDTYFGPGVAPGKTAEFEATFNHGIPTQEGLKALADYEFKNPVKTEVTDAGVIATLILDEREEYEKMLAEFARKNPGKLGWSTATAAHRAKREKKSDGRAWIKRWPIVEIAVTHKPCEPRTSAAVSLKSYFEELELKGRLAPNAVKNVFEEELAERKLGVWQLQSAFETSMRKLATVAAASSVTGVEVDVEARVNEAVASLGQRLSAAVIEQISEFIESPNQEHFYLKQFSIPESLASEGLDSHSQAVVSAVEGFAHEGGALAGELKRWQERVKDKQEFRAADPLKAGRTISAVNRDRIAAVMAKLKELSPVFQEMHGVLAELHEMAEPKKSVEPTVLYGLLAEFEQLERRIAAGK